MELISLRQKNYASLEELFNVTWKIRKFIAVSAYTDIKSIRDLFKLCKSQRLNSGNVTVQIFIDRSAKRNPQELLKIHQAMQREFDSQSGIFLVAKGSLFHSKYYLIEGDMYGKYFLGSMNLTKNGYSSNEEILLVDNKYTIKSKSASAQLAKELIDYANFIKEESVGMEECFIPQQIYSLRELLLDGKLYYRSAETNPLSFELELPKEAREIQSTVPQLSAMINNSIYIKKLADGAGGIGSDQEPKETTYNRWKSYCIETCYGYWSPNVFSEKVKSMNDIASKNKASFYSELKDCILKQRPVLDKEFRELWERLVEFLGQNNQLENWKYKEFSVAEKAWSSWYKNVEQKVSNEQYFKRLVCTIQSVPVPDVWNNPEDSEEFEDSFCNSLSYAINKRSSNEIVKAFKELGLDNDIDKIKLGQFLRKNKETAKGLFSLDGI